MSSALRFPDQGLYFLLNISRSAPSLSAILKLAEAAIEGGAKVLQLRAKHLPIPEQIRLLEPLATLCGSCSVPLLVNDHLELANRLADVGLHAGRDDGPVPALRKALPVPRLLGVTCYDDLPRAEMAARAGADYVAFGSIFPSSTKPQATPAGLQLLKTASDAHLGCPIVAIGGITPENGSKVLDAGADLLAVSSAISDHPDPLAQARAFADLFG